MPLPYLNRQDNGRGTTEGLPVTSDTKVD